jgi:hypothetical protein
LPPERTGVFSLALVPQRNLYAFVLIDGGFGAVYGFLDLSGGRCLLSQCVFDIRMPIQIIGEQRQHFARGPQLCGSHV